MTKVSLSQTTRTWDTHEYSILQLREEKTQILYITVCLGHGQKWKLKSVLPEDDVIFQATLSLCKDTRIQYIQGTYDY